MEDPSSFGGALYCAARSGKISTIKTIAAAGAKKDEKTAAALSRLDPIERAELLGLIDAAIALSGGSNLVRPGSCISAAPFGRALGQAALEVLDQ